MGGSTCASSQVPSNSKASVVWGLSQQGRMQLLSLAALIVTAASAPISPQKEEAMVASLSALKPQPAKKWNILPLDTKPSQSVGIVQQLHQVSQNINGHQQVQESSQGSVSEDGRLVGSIGHKVEASKAPGQNLLSSSSTDIEVPELGIHQHLENGPHLAKEADPETAAELAGYVLETGDQVSVVQFLQMLLKEGKLSEEQALAYVDAIKKDIEVVEEKEAKEQRVKEEVERVKAQEEAKEESLLERAAKEAAESLKKEKQEHELILRINDYLEEGLSEGKISKNLYNHLKEGLIESVVDGMREDVGSLSNSDYAHY